MVCICYMQYNLGVSRVSVKANEFSTVDAITKMTSLLRTERLSFLMYLISQKIESLKNEKKNFLKNINKYIIIFLYSLQPRCLEFFIYFFLFRKIQTIKSKRDKLNSNELQVFNLPSAKIMCVFRFIVPISRILGYCEFQMFTIIQKSITYESMLQIHSMYLFKINCMLINQCTYLIYSV